MANLDTAAKRASGMNFMALGDLLPIPDGSIGDGDKQHLLGCYSGIAFAAAAGGPFPHFLRRSNPQTGGFAA